MRAPSIAVAAGIAVVAGLAATAPIAVWASSPPEPAEAPVAAAREGLADWLAAHRPSSPSESTDLAGCPVIDLDTFERAVADVGLLGDLGGLGDWGTEVEWDEYEDIDADLMGVVCGGDTDGDSHDSSYELAAGVVAVDAGTDARAIDVLAGLGFGALDVTEADVAGVPGGDVSAGCIVDGELHACLALWSLDGLVLGVTVWSDRRALPSDAATAVLDSVLPEMLDALAGQSETEQHSATDEQAAAPSSTAIGDLGDPGGPAVDGAPVGDARTALAALLAATADTPDAAPLSACALADSEVVDAALATAGVDASLGGWGQWIGPVAPIEQFRQRGVVCEGAYVGATGDPSFPEVMLALATVDFGDRATFDAYLADYLGVPTEDETLPATVSGGTTSGRCAERDRVHDCYEVWTDGSGFAVMLHVQDRIYFDRPTASAVLDQLVPVVLSSLGSRGGEADGPLSSVTDAEIDAATAGLAAVVTAPDLPGAACAVLERAQLDAALAASGVAVPVDEWIGTATGDGSGSAESSYVCRTMPPGASDGVTLLVSEFATPSDAGDFVASVALAEGGTGADLDPAAITHGTCVNAGGTELCAEMWPRGSLVIGVTVAGPASDVGRGDASDVLRAIAPGVISTLATAAA
jgi:hypothetical protein